MYDKAWRRAGAYLHAAVWVASVLLAVVEMALARFVPHALWIALIADLLLISPLLLGRQTWYLSVSRPAEHTQEFCPTDHRALRWSVFACLRAAYTRQWGCAVAWRWGWWWRSTAVVAVSLSPALAALCLSFLAGGSGLLAAGVRLSRLRSTPSKPACAIISNALNSPKFSSRPPDWTVILMFFPSLEI